jgi:hypothetical protein
LIFNPHIERGAVSARQSLSGRQPADSMEGFMRVSHVVPALAIAATTALSLFATVWSATPAQARYQVCMDSQIACLNRCDAAFKWGSSQRATCYRGCKGRYEICENIEMEPSAAITGQPTKHSRPGVNATPLKNGILDGGTNPGPNGPAPTGAIVTPAQPSFK